MLITSTLKWWHMTNVATVCHTRSWGFFPPRCITDANVSLYAYWASEMFLLLSGLVNCMCSQSSLNSYFLVHSLTYLHAPIIFSEPLGFSVCLHPNSFPKNKQETGADVEFPLRRWNEDHNCKLSKENILSASTD